MKIIPRSTHVISTPIDHGSSISSTIVLSVNDVLDDLLDEPAFLIVSLLTKIQYDNGILTEPMYIQLRNALIHDTC